MKKIKKTLVVLVIAALILSLFPAVALAAGNWTDEKSSSIVYFTSTGHAGTAGDPYIIATRDDLIQLAVNVNDGIDYDDVYFELSGEISLSAKEWTPIGTPDHPFKGHFDVDEGDNYITNLNINDPSGSYLGLFGYTSGATISNLQIDGNITGNSIAGLIAGQADDDTSIHGCWAVGTVTVSDQIAGGLVGNYGDSLTSIENCTSWADVTGNHFIGGLVGYCSNAHVRESFTLGNVSGAGDISHDIGGLVGGAESSVFEKCCAMGAVSGACDVGGFAGNTHSSTFTDCFAKGSVLSTNWTAGSFIGSVSDSDFTRCYGSGIVGCSAVPGSYIGGFAGQINDSGSTTSFAQCYYDTTKNDFGAIGQDEGGSIDDPHITGLPTANMQGNYVLDDGHTMDDFDTGSTSGTWYGFDNAYPSFTSEPMIFTVTFFYRGGTPVSSQTCFFDDKLTTPANPTWTGHDFGGWYADAALTTPWDFDTDTVSGDNTIYSKWTLKSYAVTFNSNSGSAVADQMVLYGNKVTKPADPKRSGYTFGGWYADAALTDEWDFASDTVTGTTTLHAKWTAPSTPTPTPTPVVLSVSPAEKTIFVSGRTTLSPSQPGGTWQYDSSMLTLTQNADGSVTVTGLKKGTTTVTYTLGGTTVHAVITISETALPETGQEYTLPIVMGGLGAAVTLVLIFIQCFRRKKA